MTVSFLRRRCTKERPFRTTNPAGYRRARNSRVKAPEPGADTPGTLWCPWSDSGSGGAGQSTRCTDSRHGGKAGGQTPLREMVNDVTPAKPRCSRHPAWQSQGLLWAKQRFDCFLSNSTSAPHQSVRGEPVGLAFQLSSSTTPRAANHHLPSFCSISLRLFSCSASSCFFFCASGV